MPLEGLSLYRALLGPVHTTSLLVVLIPPLGLHNLLCGKMRSLEGKYHKSGIRGNGSAYQNQSKEGFFNE